MAPSEQGLPPGVTLRPLAAADLPAACALSAEPGWNQIDADWRLFLELGRTFLLLRDGKPIATAATLPYAGFAWVSMVLVTKSEQRRGLARFLLRHAIERLLAEGLRPVLDATPAGRAVYLGLGFRDGWGMRRFVAQRLTPAGALAEPADGTRLRPLEPADWPHLIAYDRAVFGAERGALLQRLAQRLPQAALVAERGGKLAGYSLGRDGRVMDQLGPICAEDDAVAEALLSRALASLRAPLAIDVPDRQSRLAERLAALGFTIERSLTRMAHAGESPGSDPRYFAIAGPELG